MKKNDYNPKLLCFLDLKRCLGAALNPLVGQVFEVPVLLFKDFLRTETQIDKKTERQKDRKTERKKDKKKV